MSQIIGDRYEAEEIVQDFFVNVWTARRSIHQTISIKSYFFVSVKNRAFNYLKKEQIRGKTLGKLKELVENDFLFQPDLFVESELNQALGVREKIGIYFANTGHNHEIDKWIALIDFADKVFYKKNQDMNFDKFPFQDLQKAYIWKAPVF